MAPATDPKPKPCQAAGRIRQPDFSDTDMPMRDELFVPTTPKEAKGKTARTTPRAMTIMPSTSPVSHINKIRLPNMQALPRVANRIVHEGKTTRIRSKRAILQSHTNPWTL